MRRLSIRLLAGGVVVALVLALAGCANGEAESGEHNGGESGEHNGGESGEHDEGEESGEGGEESGTQFALDETYDHVRAGARLILNYDPATNTFRGTVANTTNGTLDRVRVEVHLSNGTELGPTSPRDLAPGETISVRLPATAEAFATWSAHPEVGGSEGSGEHDQGAESGEHD